MKKIEAFANPRVGLLGNPSDLFDGAALAFTFEDFEAKARLQPASRFELAAPAAEGRTFSNFQEFAEVLHENGCYGMDRLLRASMRRFAVHWTDWRRLQGDDPLLRFRIECASTIPRQAGLAGSSAIVIAALRALEQWFKTPLSGGMRAQLALEAERDELGIASGPMDRVVQSYGGLLLMDFSAAAAGVEPESVDPVLLPRLFIAYDPQLGKVSGGLHSSAYWKWRAGDPEIRKTAQRLRELPKEGVNCLSSGDHEGFRELMRENFRLRSKHWKISSRDRRLIQMAEDFGAAAKFCGSGGSIVGAPGSRTDWRSLSASFEREGFRFLQPKISGHANFRLKDDSPAGC